MRTVKPANPSYNPGGVGAPGAAMLLPLGYTQGPPRDVSGNGYDGTFTGSPSWSDGDFGPTLGGFSTVDLVNTGAYASLQAFPFAVAFLAKNTTANTTAGECCRVLGGTASAIFQFNSGLANRVQWLVRDTSNVLANADGVNAAVSDGRWHVWMGYSASPNSHAVYCDGAPVVSTATSLGSLSFTSMTLGRAYPGVVAAWGAWQGLVPDPKALADDWLTGRFSAFRCPRVLSSLPAMISPQILRGTLGAQAGRASAAFGAVLENRGTLAAQAGRASTAFTARRVYTGTLAAQAGRASTALGAVAVPGLNPEGWWSAPVADDTFDGVDPDQTTLEA